MLFTSNVLTIHGLYCIWAKLYMTVHGLLWLKVPIVLENLESNGRVIFLTTVLIFKKSSQKLAFLLIKDKKKSEN